MSVTPLLLSTSGDSKQDSVVIWDPIAGNQVATFNGDQPEKFTLATVSNIVICAVSKKPLLQMWSFEANSSRKRLTTKGIVNALTFSNDYHLLFLAIEKNIYVYQICSGCLLAVMEASHNAVIGRLVSSNYAPSIPALLLSADSSGLVTCWLLDSIGNEFTNSQSSSVNTNKEERVSNVKPLWYAVQASRNLPNMAFVDDNMIAVASTEGLKFFDAMTGQLLHSVLTASRSLLSICVMPCDNFIFSGTENGILHTVWMKNIDEFDSYEISFRRCFVDSNLTTAEKAITCLALAPFESRLLAVGSSGGIVEILRTDAALTCLQRFSLFQSSHSSSGDKINFDTNRVTTGLMFFPRPNWLSGGSILSAGSECKDENYDDVEKSEPFVGIRPFKRHMGWKNEDLLYLRLPNLKQEYYTDPNEMVMYQDNFLQCEAPLNPFSSSMYASQTSTNTDSRELSTLKSKLEKLEQTNRDFLQVIVANMLHY